MANTMNDVKNIILTISQLDGTADGMSNDSCLQDLNFDSNMCSDLARQLNDYLASQGSKNTVSSTDITCNMTVQQIIDLAEK